MFSSNFVILSFSLQLGTNIGVYDPKNILKLSASRMHWFMARFKKQTKKSNLKINNVLMDNDDAWIFLSCVSV